MEFLIPFFQIGFSFYPIVRIWIVYFWLQLIFNIWKNANDLFNLKLVNKRNCVEIDWWKWCKSNLHGHSGEFKTFIIYMSGKTTEKFERIALPPLHNLMPDLSHTKNISTCNILRIMNISKHIKSINKQYLMLSSMY